MADGWKASCVANHGMVDGEGRSTAAGLCCVLELPVVSEADGVSELSLVKKESMVREWEGHKPGQGSFFYCKHNVSVVLLAVHKYLLPAGPDAVGSHGGWSSSDCE